MSGFIAFFSFITALFVLHLVATHVIRRQLDTRKEKAWVGGFRIYSGKTLSSYYATWPLALLCVKEGYLAIGHTLVKKEYVFSPNDIVDISIKRISFLIGRGIFINHNGQLYNDKIYFMCLPFTTKNTLKEIRRIFYASESSDSN